MAELGKDGSLSRQGNRIAARYREERRRIDRLLRQAERPSAEAAQRRELISAATRAGRAAIKAKEAADLRLVDALTRMLDAGLSIRDASERIGINYYLARKVLRPGPDARE